jgi:hypothetical protein
MKRSVLLVPLAMLACKESHETLVADASIDAPYEPETYGELEALWKLEVATGRWAIDDLLGHATTVRVVRTQMLDSRRIVERCGARTLDAKRIAGLRTALAGLRPAELGMTPACAFIPTLRVDIVAPERILRFEVCLHCSELKGEKLDFHFINGPDRDPLHEWAAHEFSDDPFVADPKVIDLRPEQREPTPCSP